MTIDRTALRRLLHSWLDADQAAVYGRVPDLLDELDAKDQTIADINGLLAFASEKAVGDSEKIASLERRLEAADRRIAQLEHTNLETVRVTGNRQEATDRRVADLELRLSIATESNVNDRRLIAALEAELAKEAEATHQLAEEHEKQGMDLAFHRRGHSDALAAIASLESQLTASRDIIRHFEQERDSWPAAYRERAKRTDARIAALEMALADAIYWIKPGLVEKRAEEADGERTRLSELLHSEET